MEGGESFLDPHSTLTRLIYSLIHTCISFIFPLSLQYFLNRQAFLRFPLSPLSLLLPLFTLANSFLLSLSIFLSFSVPLSYSLCLTLSLFLSPLLSVLFSLPFSQLFLLPSTISKTCTRCRGLQVLPRSFPFSLDSTLHSFLPLFSVLSLFDSLNHKILFGVCFLKKKFSFPTQTLNYRSSN